MLKACACCFCLLFFNRLCFITFIPMSATDFFFFTLYYYLCYVYFLKAFFIINSRRLILFVFLFFDSLNVFVLERKHLFFGLVFFLFFAAHAHCEKLLLCKSLIIGMTELIARKLIKEILMESHIFHI